MGGKPQRPTTSEETARGTARTARLIGIYLASILIISVRHRVTGFLLRFCVLLQALRGLGRRDASLLNSPTRAVSGHTGAAFLKSGNAKLEAQCQNCIPCPIVRSGTAMSGNSRK